MSTITLAGQTAITRRAAFLAIPPASLTRTEIVAADAADIDR
ncbi:MAG: hypothetical protein ACRDA8_04690 [Shewanella sp.]